MKSYGNLAESFQRFCAVSGIAERNPRIQPGNIVLTMFHTRIHEKQDNCLVLIAPTARWILIILVLDKKLSKLLIAPQVRQELMRRLLRQTAAKGRR